MKQVQVMTLDREIEWTGDVDDLLQSNGELSSVEVRWIEGMEIGQEFQTGPDESKFIIRRIT